MKNLIRSLAVAGYSLVMLSSCSLISSTASVATTNMRTSTHEEYINRFKSEEEIKRKYTHLLSRQVSLDSLGVETLTLIYSVKPNILYDFHTQFGTQKVDYELPEASAFVLFQLQYDEVVYWETRGRDEHFISIPYSIPLVYVTTFSDAVLFYIYTWMY